MSWPKKQNEVRFQKMFSEEKFVITKLLFWKIALINLKISYLGNSIRVHFLPILELWLPN